jgi:hypothetical protein
LLDIARGFAKIKTARAVPAGTIRAPTAYPRGGSARNDRQGCRQGTDEGCTVANWQISANARRL